MTDRLVPNPNPEPEPRPQNPITHLECSWQHADLVASQPISQAGLAAAVEQLLACLGADNLIAAVNVHDQLLQQVKQLVCRQHSSSSNSVNG